MDYPCANPVDHGGITWLRFDSARVSSKRAFRDDASKRLRSTPLSMRWRFLHSFSAETLVVVKIFTATFARARAKLGVECESVADSAS